MERILVIAGGAWQAPLVERVKELGYEVINSNLYEDSPGFAFADHCEVADVLDKERNLEIARKYDVRAVMTDESDIAVPTVAYVAEKMGLPGIGEDMAGLFTNKYRMRCFCREKEISSVEFCLCRTPEEAAEFVRGLGRRCIMKPLDSQSSRGVFILDEPQDAFRFFEKSVSYSSTESSVIVERFIDGVEFTVDGLVYNGRHCSLAISEKKHFSHNPSIASELFFSYENENYDYEKLRRQNDRLVEQSGLPFGFTHAEYKWENGEFYLIEIAARGGGTRISSHIVPLMTGIDNYRFLIEASLGYPIDESQIRGPKATRRCAVLKFLSEERAGALVSAIRGAEEVRANPHILELRLEFGVGDRVYQAQDDRSRIGFYVAYGESEQELRRTMDWVRETLKIEYEETDEEVL